MSANAPAAKRIRKWKAAPRALDLLFVLLVFACVLAARYLGVLQLLEFQIYDFFIRHQPKAPTSDPIVLVEMTEEDIQTLNYPIHDDKLAELLLHLEAARPAVIGLDIWRDVPVPRTGQGLPKLNEVLLAHSNIVAIFTLGGIAPPAVLKSNSHRIAFNDNFPVDTAVDATIPKVRRSFLFQYLSQQPPADEILDSFPFLLALQYLERMGIQPESDPDDARGVRLGKARLRAFRSNDGAYVRAGDDGWQMLLDFKCPDEFTRFSFGDALAGAIPPDALRDKIVLVGMHAVSVLDERVTPIRRNHQGIEVQALTVHQLLRMALEGERPLRTWSDWQEDAWILLGCVAGILMGYKVRSPWRLVPASLACILAFPGLAWLAFDAGWWIPTVAPVAGFLCATALAVSQASSHERSMRSVLMKLYSRHVSKEIAESVWANRDSFLEGNRPLAQKLTVTVLFTDLKGFSTISEKMEAARLYEWLNGYLGAMARVIQDHGGVLKQFTGDGILALFGVPVPHTTRAEQAGDATAAVRCALAMGRCLAGLSVEWQKAGLPSVSMRAGIYTGEAAAGSVGSDDRFEYAVVGDVVNTASRLESYDKTFADPDSMPTRCRILIGAPTHDLLGGAFQTREIGLLQVKGKTVKVAVFQVLDESDGAARK